MSVDERRRRFLKTLLLGAAAAPLARTPILAGPPASGAQGAGPGPAGPASPGAPGTAPGTAASAKYTPPAPIVYRARRGGILPAGGVAPDADKLADALGAAVSRVAGEPTPVAGMRRLFRPHDVVGIKVNCIAGKGMSPHPEMVALLAKWLQQAGVSAANIVVIERSDRELDRAGFRPSRSADGMRVIGVEDSYEAQPREWGPNASCFAKVLVEEITALINVGVLKDHHSAGLAVGMKNWYGVIHNPNKCHDDGCHPYVAHLAAFPLIRDKVRFTVIDAMTAQCSGGPGFSPRWTWPYDALLVSADPVALDTVGMKIIDERRKEVSLPTLAEEKRAPKWLAEAARLGLGEADLAKIKIEDV